MQSCKEKKAILTYLTAAKYLTDCITPNSSEGQSFDGFVIKNSLLSPLCIVVNCLPN